MEPGEIINRFTSHETDAEQSAKIDTVRSLFLDFGRFLASILPEGREESLAFTKLEEASFFAIAAIARKGK